MKNFDNMIKGLQQEIKVPEEVWKKYTDTLSALPDKKGEPLFRRNRWIKYAVSAAAIAATVTTVGLANSALAAKIPILGNIFKNIQQQSTFSGDYSDKADILTEENIDGTLSDNTEYTVQNAGVTFTASEIYCDGISVFLTAKVESEQGGLSAIPGNSMYLQGDWSLSGNEEKTALMNNNLEGQIVDDHTFTGMLKLDLDEQNPDDQSQGFCKLNIEKGTIELNLSMIGYDDINDNHEEDISASHKIQGDWNLVLPFTVDTSAVQEITVNKEMNGYSLKQVFVSPYQVITNTEVPYTEREITREEFEATMKEKTGGSDDFGITYEEYAKQKGKAYDQCQTLILNQDGERLTSIEEFRGKAVYAVQGMEITKLKIYVFDNVDKFTAAYESDAESEALDQAVLSAEVDIK